MQLHLKTEQEQLKTQARLEQDRLKFKLQDDMQEMRNDYEIKMTNMHLTHDSLRKEIENLKQANEDLELERNTIRQNLKSMLECQMKETMQILGINNNYNNNIITNCQMFKMEDFNKVETPKIKNKISVEPVLDTTSISNTTTNQVDQLYPPTSVILDSLSSMNSKKNEQDREACLNSFYESFKAKMSSTFAQVQNKTVTNLLDDKNPPAEIKDTFILNQIDMINKYYKIDNSTLNTCLKNPLKDETEPNFGNQTLDKYRDSQNGSNSRSKDLRHFIEVLLDKSPSSDENNEAVMNQASTPKNTTQAVNREIKQEESWSESTLSKDIPNNNNNTNYYDFSDGELGYSIHKKQSLENYDDVKRNLNFDEDDDESTCSLSNSLSSDKEPSLVNNNNKKGQLLTRKKVVSSSSSFLTTSFSSINSMSTIQTQDNLGNKKSISNLKDATRQERFLIGENNVKNSLKSTSMAAFGVNNNNYNNNAGMHANNSRKKWK